MLFQPWRFARTGHVAPNRLVVAAMTNKQSDPDGALHDDELEWLARRARGGFGVVTTCAAFVSPDGKAWEGELGVHDDAMLPGLRRLAGAIRKEGALGLVQLFHGGVRAPSELTGQQPWSASAHTPISRSEDPEPARAATEEDIVRTIAAFGAAAARCEAAGFDGAELHGAHGYLLSQFQGTVTNTRTDAYGGSLENRARLVRRCLKAAQEATSDRFILGVRLSPSIPDIGVTLDDTLQLAQWLADDGADFVHVSLWESSFDEDGAPTPLTAQFRQALPPSCPLIVTGMVWTPDQARALMDQGAELVGMARAAIANPDWPRLARDPGYAPLRPPYAPQTLRDAALSERFIDYMRRWPDFVEE